MSRITFPVRTARNRVLPDGKAATFLQITFRHNAFDTCMKLLDMQAGKGLSFSGEAR